MKITLFSLFVVVYIVIAIVTNKWIKRKLTEKYKRTRNKPYTAEDRDTIDSITLGTIIIGILIIGVLFAIPPFEHAFYAERTTKDANIKVLSMDASIGETEGHNYVVKLECDGTIYILEGKENFNRCFGKVNKEIKGKVIKRTRLDKTVWNTIKLD